MNKKELRKLLADHGVVTSVWGKGDAKTVDHLHAELVSGEAILAIREGALVRVIATVVIGVYFSNGSKPLVLKEEKQVFVGGRTRNRDLGTSLGEKMKAGEIPIEAVLRALAEELGIHDEVRIVPKDVVVKGPAPSGSFPGLVTVNTLYHFDVFIPAAAYKPEGYVERQPDKSTYFVWKEM